MAVPLRATSGVVGSTFAEHAPPPRLDAVVACTWEGRPGGPRSLRVLPDGCADLVWDGERLRVAGAGVSACRHAVVTPAVGLRLRVGAVGRVLDWPAHELAAGGVDLAALWGPRAARWERRLADAPDPAAARRLLADLVVERLAAGHVPDPVVAEAVRLLGEVGGAVAGSGARGSGARGDDDGGGDGVGDDGVGDDGVGDDGVGDDGGVGAVGAALGASPRALRRRVRHDVGVGPKALARVLRFRRFLAHLGPLAAGTATLAGVAAELGYADQAHLSRECRALADATPRRLVTLWADHAAPAGP